uniref:Uncharacterized protein n=1 Tax=mine drainage metagenome TaxID=410659 RepID=E6Q9S6_9ZZZZ
MWVYVRKGTPETRYAGDGGAMIRLMQLDHVRRRKIFKDRHAVLFNTYGTTAARKMAPIPDPTRRRSL